MLLQLDAITVHCFSLPADSPPCAITCVSCSWLLDLLGPVQLFLHPVPVHSWCCCWFCSSLCQCQCHDRSALSSLAGPGLSWLAGAGCRDVPATLGQGQSYYKRVDAPVPGVSFNIIGLMPRLWSLLYKLVRDAVERHRRNYLFM